MRKKLEDLLRSIGDEPDPHRPDVCSFEIHMVDGHTVKRRFLKSDSIQSTFFLLLNSFI